MKLITRDTDYAVRAICFMAKSKGKVVSVPVLVKELKVPYPFLRKILQQLNKKRILKSQKGSGGGFQLAVPAERISLVELIGIFQGPFKLNECILRKRLCPNVSRCSLSKKIKNMEKYIMHELQNITVASLLK
ncbi:Rrf2 family transcriptional regulator [bacterium]|nr:MAG: Rrf2 family transcriptional regulator [bacterium]